MSISSTTFYIVVSSCREEAFKKNMWEKMSSYFFENIYIPAAQADNTGCASVLYV